MVASFCVMFKPLYLSFKIVYHTVFADIKKQAKPETKIKSHKQEYKTAPV